MKAEFLKAMRFMWPRGLPGVNKAQWRDVIRIYAMGYANGIRAVGDEAAVAQSANECKAIADPNWWPDESWKWW